MFSRVRFKSKVCINKGGVKFLSHYKKKKRRLNSNDTETATTVC